MKKGAPWARPGWTDVEVDLLQRLLGEGLSSGQIGARMQKTRNQVIGKVSRMGMRFANSQVEATKRDHQMRRASAARQRRVQARRRPANRPEPKAPVVPMPMPAVDDRHEENIAHILMLEDHHCRWPVGHPGDDDFRWCGRRKVDVAGAAYCAGHMLRAMRQINDDPGPPPKRQHDYKRKFEGAM